MKPFEYDDLAARLDAFRKTHLALTGVDRAGQDDIDAFFAPLGRGREVLPKGLSAETADAVLATLAGGRRGLAPPSAPRTVGLSRVSARRYLEHFVAREQAVVRLQYGGSGRPERRYRLRG